MEHHEDNAQFDNYLQNRLAESLQISGGDGEHQHLADHPAPGELSADGIPASTKSDQRDGDEDEEWKYIHEVQQSEKLQQKLPQETGNGFNHDLIFGNGLGNGAAAGLVFEEEDVEVIRNDGDFSTNSNTTTSTGEVAAQEQHQPFPEADEQLAELQPSQDLVQEDEDEPSSVATTFGTSSLSENNPTPLDQEEPVASQPANKELLEGFDNKENSGPVEEVEESHSQLNPNAVAFVPSFGSQPSSPIRNIEDPVFGINSRQLLGAPLDDLVAESPRKGSARENMDEIAVPEEHEFDKEADKRPHELEQESDIFGRGNLEQQLLNGASSGSVNASVVSDVLDHGPETSVDLDLSIDQLPTNGDIMKQSIYAEQNVSIEDILNSVQPLPTQSGEEFVEKELLNVEEKEHVSQSPSTEELQFQQVFHTDSDLQQKQQQPLFGSTDEDPMQASFYLEHTSSEAQKEQSDPFDEHVLLLDTSAPMFSPEVDEPVATLELESQQADIVDITPSPLSSTEEKHLVEDTKEKVMSEEPLQIVEQEIEHNQDLEKDSFEKAAEPLVEEYAAFNAASGNITQHDEEISPVQGINPFAQPFTPAHLSQVEQEVVVMADEEPAKNQPELQLQEELEEEQYLVQPNNDYKYFNLADKVAANKPELQEELLSAAKDATFEDFTDQLQTPEKSVPQQQIFIAADGLVSQEQQMSAPEELLSPAAPEDTLSPEALEEPFSPLKASDEPALPQTEEIAPVISKTLAEAAPEIKTEEPVEIAVVTEVAAVAATATAAVATMTASKAKGKPCSPDTKKAATKPGATAKPKPAALTPSAIKKITATISTTSARPRTAPMATKTSFTKPSATPPIAAARKPLSSNPAATVKAAPRTTMTSTRPATAPAGKAAVAAKTSASKPPANGTGSGAKATTRSLTTSIARKPVANGTGTPASSVSSRKPGTTTGTGVGLGLGASSAAGSKPRLPSSAPAAAAKPKVSSPRSAVTSTVRKVPSTNGTSLSARSPTKPTPTTNGLGKSSTTSSTTTTITKTFTARPAPKFTHSATSATNSNGSMTRRLPSAGSSTATSAAAPRRPSPLKSSTTTAQKASPLKASTTPLKPKAKESAPIKPSPAGLKTRKITPLKGATPSKAAEVVPPAEAASNGDGAKEEAVVQQNGNGLHDVEDAQVIHEQLDQEHFPVASQNVEVSLLDF
ncbi:hypothetical protein KR009_007532 [Drosophila setifemur]|nr:hypothetical protein KR009_007532 [Drosophila setifemur]